MNKMLRNKAQGFKGIVLQHYKSHPLFWQVGLCFLVGLYFNLTTWPYMKFGLEGVTEANFFWVDEGLHLETLERMQETQSLQLLHHAYTGFYPNLSYLAGWIIAGGGGGGGGGGGTISTPSFAWGSKWVSLISLNLYLGLGFFICYTTFRSFGWAFLGLLLLAGQRFHLVFATRMHPEGLMLLCTLGALYAGWQFLLKGRSKHFYMLAIATGLAVGTKLQMVFLIPWGGGVFLLTVWKFRWFSAKHLFLWISTGAAACALSFFVAAPYQVLNFSELLAGIKQQSDAISDYYQGQFGVWKWFAEIVAEIHLGPFFAILFLLALLMGAKRWKAGWRQQGKGILNSPQETLFLVHSLWLLIGAGYIVVKYQAYINRYLIHVHVSFLLILLLGLYWWVQAKKPFYNRGVQFLIFLMFYGGLQGQWRHTWRDIDHRENIHAAMADHRQFGRELVQWVPVDANILHTNRVYIPHKRYPHAHLFVDHIASGKFQEDKWDYLIVNQQHRPGFQSGLMIGSQSDRAKVVTFWENLANDGIQGQFAVVAHDPKIDVTIYRNLKKTMP